MGAEPMIVETLHFEAMLVVLTVLSIFIATIWSTNGAVNIVFKLILTCISLWATANTVVVLWFN